MYGEQVILFNTISGNTVNMKDGQWYYMSAVNVHVQVNNNILPFTTDTKINIRDYLTRGIQSTR